MQSLNANLVPMSEPFAHLKTLPEKYAPLLEPLNAEHQLYCGQIVAFTHNEDINLEALEAMYRKLKKKYISEVTKRNAVELLTSRAPLENLEANTKFAREKVKLGSTNLTNISGECEALKAQIIIAAAEVEKRIASYAEAQHRLAAIIGEASEAENKISDEAARARNALQEQLRTEEMRVSRLRKEISEFSDILEKKQKSIINQKRDQAAPAVKLSEAKINANAQMEGMVEWTKQMVDCVGKLSGVRIENLGCNTAIARIHVPTYEGGEAHEFIVSMEFDESTGRLLSATLSPPSESNEVVKSSLAASVKFQTIVTAAAKLNNISFLLRETRLKLYNHICLQAELAQMRRTHPVSYSDRMKEVVITLPSGIIATLKLSEDYPNDFDAITLSSLDGFEGWNCEVLEDIKRRVVAEQYISITDITVAISEAINAIGAQAE